MHQFWQIISIFYFGTNLSTFDHKCRHNLCDTEYNLHSRKLLSSAAEDKTFSCPVCDHLCKNWFKFHHHFNAVHRLYYDGKQLNVLFVLKIWRMQNSCILILMLNWADVSSFPFPQKAAFPHDHTVHQLVIFAKPAD